MDNTYVLMMDNVHVTDHVDESAVAGGSERHGGAAGRGSLCCRVPGIPRIPVHRYHTVDSNWNSFHFLFNFLS